MRHELSEYRFEPGDTLIDVARELAEASGWELVEPDTSNQCWRLRKNPLPDPGVWQFEGDA
jgi:hypothetical protein